MAGAGRHRVESSPINMPGSSFTIAELRDLLGREEGQFLEFKSLWNQDASPAKALERRRVRDLIAECVAAFANSDGGTLVLGVEDDGQPTGHNYPEEAIFEFGAAPRRRLRPSLDVAMERYRLDDHEILVFRVGVAPEAVMVEGNGFPYRVGDSIVREPEQVINERKQAYRRVGYERQVRPDASLHDLDLELARSFLATTVWRNRTVENLLESYGLVVPRAGTIAVTNAALLLFSKVPIARWHPTAAIRFFRVMGTQKLHGAQRNVTQLHRLELPIAALIPEAYQVISGQIRRSERLHSLFFREVPEYPTFAWQEALVNAVAHRDYGDQGRNIEVWFYEDRMEVLSPGDLVPPVTLADLRARRPVHASRNPLVARVLVEAGIMREEGEGIPRIFAEMEESFLKLPEIEVESATFRLTLRNEPIFLGPSAEWQGLVQQLPVGMSQKRILMAYPEGFTNEDYRRLNHVDRDQAYREIQELVARGIVSPPGAAGRGAIYRLASDLRSARAWLEEKVPRIREFFRTHQYLKNADYRQMFGLTRHTALQELRKLVEDQYLRAEGERRGSRYLPGPALLDPGPAGQLGEE